MAKKLSSVDKLVQKARANMRAGRAVSKGIAPKDIEAMRYRYTHFIDKLENGYLVASELVASRLDTPRPLLHLMASNHYDDYNQWGSFWDQHRGGFSCVDSVLAGKMTSHLDTNYVPTAPEPQDVREFFIHRDRKSWPMFPVVGYEDDKYKNFQSRMGMDTYDLQSTRGKLDCKLSVTVHPDQPMEVWEMKITNVSGKQRNFSWFFRVRVNVDSFPFYYFVPRVVCEGLLEDGSLVFVNHDQGNKHPRAAFLAASAPLDGYDMMAEKFDGGPRRAAIPAAVANGKCFDTVGLQPYAGLIAAGQFKASLAPGASKTWRLAFGKCPTDKGERKQFLASVKKNILSAGANVRGKLADIWKKKVCSLAIQTPDIKLDRYFNVWNRYQARNQSRFIRALDKVGYRDILQDLLGVCDFEPEYVRSQLATAMRYQYPDGRAVRQYEKFIGSGHDLRSYQDSPIWIQDLLCKYLKQTGDRAFLDQQVPFLNEQTLQPDQSNTGSVYDHACRPLRTIFSQTGYHGLCKIGYGDWNDALSKIGGANGVSVWLSCAFVFACRKMAEIADWYGRGNEGNEFRWMADQMTARINEHAWDGQWYIYAINDQGQPIGSKSNDEGKIHLNVNAWALFTGVAAAAGREQQVWEAIEQLDTPIGHLLMKPAYTLASRDGVGRIADQLPGMFENGSMYTHGESFFLFALVCRGQADKWYDHLQKTLPENQIPDIATNPPHQQSNFFVGPDHPSFGENLFSNFTGSLAWYRRAIEQVCGVIAEFDGLVIAPMPPSHWNEYKVTRNFRGTQVEVAFRRGEKFEVIIDGQPRDRFIHASEISQKTSMKIEVTYA